MQARTQCIQLLRDCADICFQAVAYMGRGSTFSRQLCDLCAQICDACAAECDQFRDEHCQRCAAECRRCAEECRKMAGKVAASVEPEGRATLTREVALTAYMRGAEAKGQALA